MSFAAVVGLIARGGMGAAPRPRDGRVPAVAVRRGCAAICAASRITSLVGSIATLPYAALSFRPRHALRRARQSAAPCR